MKNQEFKDFLFKSAVFAMACDGEIAEIEIAEIKNIVVNEIYFLGYEFEGPLNQNISDIKLKGKAVINEFLQEVESKVLNEHQEILLLEVLLRIIEADNDIQPNEIKFLQLVKSKLKIDEQTVIVKFPKHIDYLLDFQNHGLHQEFTEEIDFK